MGTSRRTGPVRELGEWTIAVEGRIQYRAGQRLYKQQIGRASDRERG